MSATQRFTTALRRTILATLVLGGCQPGAEPGRQADQTVVTLDDVHRVPTPDVLARIVDVEPAEDGRVWVLNALEPFFVLLGTDGQIHRSFGSRGGGPREFDDPIELVRGPASQVWAFDNLRKAFRPISGDHGPDLAVPTQWRVASFGNAGMGMVATAPWIESQGGDFLIARKRPSAPPSGGLGLWHADLFRVAADASMELSLAVPDLLGDPGDRYPGATILLPYPLWTVCGDGSFGLYDPLVNALRRFDPDGLEEPAIALGDARLEAVTFDRVFGMVYRLFAELRPGGQAPDSVQMRAVLREQFTQRQDEFGSILPEYADLRCTEDGTFWLQPFQVANGRFERGREWIRLGGDGSWSRVSLPPAFTVHRIDGHRMWGTVVDSLGVTAVAWVDLNP